MENILNLSLDELKKWMTKNGESAFRAKQVIDWIYKGILVFDDMKNIPKSVKEKLQNHFVIGIPKVIDEYKSNDDSTRKLLLSLEDDNIIECVIMRYHHGLSICISTQVGCRMGCKFCASTIDGRVRNLEAGEMIGEILAAQNLMKERISNVVLMGSGEPLDNFDNVIKFLNLANSDYGLNIGQRHITLSTCGIVPKIKELADLNLSITLAISLHAFSDEKRKEVMPIANKYSLNELLDVCREYIEKTGRRITFEYALIKDVNDNKEEARCLAELLKGMICHVNLIPVNEIKENTFKRSDMTRVKEFANVLNSRNIETTIRREMGADINAACGQLRRSYLSTQKNEKGCFYGGDDYGCWQCKKD